MPKQNKRRTKRVKNLMVICTLSAVLLSISTYAWFIGMRTVNVTRFDVEIASTEGLLLSLDGELWDETVNISEDILDLVSYDGHTNSWGGTGLKPMSSVGDMDLDASRMKIFEKASLTPTKGGYRLLASRVNNHETGKTEQDGYVVFDLFVKNHTGDQYITELEELDEEAIFLTTDSLVKVGSGGVSNTGIENSVRVAFTQIGRVDAKTTDASKITGITCSDNYDDDENLYELGDVTGICREAQIWEPNDKEHVDGAINWYEKSCRKRTGATVEDGSYEDDDSEDRDCGTVVQGTSYPTYAVADVIGSANNVDIYDGPTYNGYTGSSSLLKEYEYFTDTQKMKTGTERPKFMDLAPSSITKLRIYIYIEGQDIDNYDFAQIGKKISVNFGFTKERFTPEEIGNPDNNIDVTKPVITLDEIGEPGSGTTMTLQIDEEFVDPGSSVTDNDETVVVVVDTSKLDNTKAGTYLVYYRAEDSAGNKTVAVRKVIVEGEVNP
ncbi:MAG: DUF5011 domain-containing protein [Bacilli bacterium]|nr:DUF5011 domain-containing protein [Bacilli bacterium]MDD4282903.1 DUF5011 domain-containing protein [Bacilli bacterium]MDD4718688.1 DUF5011 domain-containing protein [Bacilli bacterium]